MFAYAWLRNVVAATIAAATLGNPAFAQDGTARIVATEGAPAFAILRASLAEIGGGSENRVQGTAAGQALRLFCDGQANVG